MSTGRSKVREVLKSNTMPHLVSLQKIEISASGDVHSRRRIPSAEIIFVTEGVGTLWVHDKEFVLERGDLLLLNEGESFRMQANEGTVVSYQCAFNNFQLCELPPDVICSGEESFHFMKSGRYFNRIESLFTEMYLETTNKADGAVELSSACLALVLVYIHRIRIGAERQTQLSPISMCRQLRDYIDNHFGSPITLRSLADMFFVSPDYVSHVFKSEIGESPIHYLIKCRIREAKRLLVYTNMTLREISTIIGYDNMTHFSSLFKKNTGFSPGQYRQIERDKFNH